MVYPTSAEQRKAPEITYRPTHRKYIVLSNYEFFRAGEILTYTTNFIFRGRVNQKPVFMGKSMYISAKVVENSPRIFKPYKEIEYSEDTAKKETEKMQYEMAKWLDSLNDNKKV